ncbi:MAG: peptidase [Ferruginibacter sp.]|nr:peptidase [Ferruginibacter sp.]
MKTLGFIPSRNTRLNVNYYTQNLRMQRILLPVVTLIFFVSCQKNVEPAPVPAPIPVIAPFKILDSAGMVNDLQLLSSDAFKGRKAGTPEVVLTHQLIQTRLRTALNDSLAPGYAQDFSVGGIARKNLLGVLRGTLYPDRYIVAGAHYDHLGVNGTGVVFHGADDNASGVACVLAMAKYFKQHPPKYSMIFALWDAEEVGLKGSEYFVNNLPAGISLSTLKFNLNMDMIARSDNNKIWASGLSHYPAFAYLVDSVKGSAQTELLSGFDKLSDPQDWTYLSDHGNFFQKNIPYLYLGVEDHPDYHKTTDTFDKINLGRYIQNANIAAQMMLLLDRKLN